MKSGFIAILGRPNAGKSTLINSIMKEKIAITTQKAQTTRNAILGILNDEDSQIVFIDTPGIHEAKTALGTYMNREALSQAEGVDIIYYIVDGTKGLQSEDKQILERVFSYGATSKGYLTDSVQYYPEDVKTNMNRDFRISEIIREKIILNTREEIPHLVAVRIEEIKEKTSKVQIEATTTCNKDTHKGIIIGRSGSMLKKINDQASSDIARLFDGKKIILSLYVKVEEDWLNSQKQLFDLGYFSGDKYGIII